MIRQSDDGRFVEGRRHDPVPAEPDEHPDAWTDEQFARAERAVGGKVVRPATGTLTRPRGRPRLENAKEQVSIRLDPDVLEVFRETGPGWQGRLAGTLSSEVNTVQAHKKEYEMTEDNKTFIARMKHTKGIPSHADADRLRRIDISEALDRIIGRVKNNDEKK